MASSMELLGRSFLPAAAGGLSSAAAPAGRLAVRVRRQGSRRRSLRSTAPVAALAERVVVTPPPAERPGAPPEPQPQSIAARAVVTVRRRRKEDAKQRVVEQLDAYADRLGRSVLLELVSTETDPSKNPVSSSSPHRRAVEEFHGCRVGSCHCNLLLPFPRFPTLQVHGSRGENIPAGAP